MLVSIFNDVLGPVMRGPSSSHCAAALRIGRLARDLMNGLVSKVVVRFDQHGSLATTHASQGSDVGLWAGLLGWDADDERVLRAEEFLRASGIHVHVEIVELHDSHPNTYHLQLQNAETEHTLTAISTGGGMVEVVELDGFAVSMCGDYYETLLEVEAGQAESVAAWLAERFQADEVLVCEPRATTFRGDSVDGGQKQDVRRLVEVKASRFVPADLLEALRSEHNVLEVFRLRPVLPVLSCQAASVPFTSCGEMVRYNVGRGWPLWRLAVEYEAARGGFDEPEVLKRAEDLVCLWRRSIQQGLAGTQFTDRILGAQSGRFRQKLDANKLIDAGVLNRIVLYVSALMEVKSAWGVIVAAPTAGACGTLPGAVLATADARDLSDKHAAQALLAGGLIGVFIASRSTFAAEVAGCQAECGAASSMAAAALVELAGGTLEQAVAAASMALQNSLGMVCDPVANRVEVPCLGKNVMAAANALSCANMALADYDPVIPLDEVIEAADQVGRSLPRELRCTALGGLSVTPTARRLAEKLNRDRQLSSN